MAVLLERIGRVAPLGIRFHDAVTGVPIPDSLHVVGYPNIAPVQRRTAFTNASGVYVLQNLAGLRAIENGEGDEDFWATLPPPQVYTIEVTDLRGRYLPCRFEANVPTRGVFELPCLPVESPPAQPQASIPLFPGAGRTVIGGRAIVRANLYDPLREQVAAWALVELYLDGRRLARAIADTLGGVLLDFPYPDPIDFLPESPLSTGISLTSQVWTLDIRAGYLPLPAEPARLDVCAAINQPAATLWSAWDGPSGVTPLTEITLEFGKELILRTQDVDSGLDLSRLFVTSPGSPP